MNKMFDEKGNFSEEGKRCLIDLKYGLEQLMSSDQVNDMTENDLLVLGGLLNKMMSEAVSAKISRKKQIDSTFASMSDEEFETYLKEKYGSIWQFISLTEEELKRVKPISQEKIEELLKQGAERVGHPPCNGVRFPRRCSKTYK